MTRFRRKRWIAAVIIFLARHSRLAAAGAPPVLVRDINPVRRDYAASSLVGFDGNLYFNADVRSRGNGLWRTDGSSEGTVLIREGYSYALTPAGGLLYFLDGTGLWRTDGSAAGVLLIAPRPDGTNIFSLNAVGTRLYFVAYGHPQPEPREEPIEHELWASDGTEEGTVRLRSFPDNGYPNWLVDVNGTLFFTADDGSGWDLWKSDGTATGTVPVTRFASTGAPLTYPLTGLTAAGSLLFFIHPSGFLWRSDGTAEGTAALGVAPQGEMTAAGDALVFVAGFEIWTSDGTEAGTFQLTAFGTQNPLPHRGRLTAVGGRVFFFAVNGIGSDDLWRTDGTFLGTTLVQNGFEVVNTFEKNSGRYFYFQGVRGNDAGLWRSDGTLEGTVRIKEGGAAELTDVDDTLLFVSGGLWQSDGTEAGTRPLPDIFRDTLGSDPVPYADLDGTLLFSADDGSHGRELWRTDGTVDGTDLVRDIRAFGDSLPTTSLFSSHFPDVARLNGVLFFAAEDAEGVRLWRSDGTESGTQRVSESGEGAFASFPSDLTSLNDTLLFWADDGTHGFELWRSDGTEAGTRLLADVLPGPVSSICPRMKCRGALDPHTTPVGDSAFFVASSDDTGLELWKTDGTTAGTERVSGPFPPQTRPDDLVAANGLLFFRVDSLEGLSQLWRSDGTSTGTVPLPLVQPSSMTSAGGALVFSVTTAPAALWRSDGTETGTTAIRDLPPGSAFASALAPLGEDVVFLATDAEWRLQLWRSDLTHTGTVAVKDLPSQLPLSYNLAAIDGTVYFTIGGQIWRSDGSEAGTSALADFGLRFSPPTLFTPSGSKVFFTAEFGEDGRELWAVPEVAVDTPTSTPTVSAPSPTPKTGATGGGGSGCHLGDERSALAPLAVGLATALVCACVRRRPSDQSDLSDEAARERTTPT
jgi:ELWxxDGT repeat protein